MSELTDDGERLLDALLAIVTADGDVDPDELGIVSRSYAELTGRTIDPLVLQRCAEVRLSSSDPTALAPDLGVGLDDEAKRRVLTAALAIAEADGFVLEEEDGLLVRLAEHLGLAESAYREVVQRRSSHPGQ